MRILLNANSALKDPRCGVATCVDVAIRRRRMLAFKLSNRTVDVRAIIAMAASSDKESPQPNFPACARMKAAVNASRLGTHDCSISSAIEASSNSKDNR